MHDCLNLHSFIFAVDNLEMNRDSFYEFLPVILFYFVEFFYAVCFLISLLIRWRTTGAKSKTRLALWLFAFALFPKTVCSIFYGRQIPIEVCFFCRWEKNLLADCCWEILVIFERFRRFYNRKLRLCKEISKPLECLGKKYKAWMSTFFPVSNS